MATTVAVGKSVNRIELEQTNMKTQPFRFQAILALLIPITLVLLAACGGGGGDGGGAAAASTPKVSPKVFGTAALIETDAGNASNPQIAFDANGNALAVWEQSDGTRSNIWANRYQ